MLVTADRIVAYQVFESELRSADTVYFLSHALRIYAKSRNFDYNLVLVHLDFARYHRSKEVMSSSIASYLLFNAKARPEFNLVERVFSKLRDIFKTRQAVNSNQELPLFNELIRRANNSKDFSGYLRATIREVNQAAEFFLSQQH